MLKEPNDIVSNIIDSRTPLLSGVNALNALHKVNMLSIIVVYVGYTVFIIWKGRWDIFIWVHSCNFIPAAFDDIILLNHVINLTEFKEPHNYFWSSI